MEVKEVSKESDVEETPDIDVDELFEEVGLESLKKD